MEPKIEYTRKRSVKGVLYTQWKIIVNGKSLTGSSKTDAKAEKRANKILQSIKNQTT